MSLIDWAAEKVQTFTGEKERRTLVAQLKSMHGDHKEYVHQRVEVLNNKVSKFNKIINVINHIRLNSVKKNLNSVKAFLSRIGNLEGSSFYVGESEKKDYVLPERAFTDEEAYILDVDWSDDEVFRKTFFKSVFGARSENKENNISMQKMTGEYKIKITGREDMLGIEEGNLRLSSDIAHLYQETISMVNRTIEEKITPEVELAVAMLEAEEVKNLIIAKVDIPSKQEVMNIKMLLGTPYEHHYRFVKNTFLFYVLSEKIYSTPVLSNLLQNLSEKEDFVSLKEQADLLTAQDKKLLPIHTKYLEKEREAHGS
ncbi:hypothetical protein [Bacillus mycoides]|uniref:hypothetical protein n=1 Tax=Bacillus mycoides TaxID=1405 RepID=UPI003D64D7B6